MTVQIKIQFTCLGLGINNISGSHNFTFIDGRDYFDEEYSNWANGEPDLNNGYDNSYYDFGGGSSTNNKEWYNGWNIKLEQVKAFVCNDPNLTGCHSLDQKNTIIVFPK